MSKEIENNYFCKGKGDLLNLPLKIKWWDGLIHFFYHLNSLWYKKSALDNWLKHIYDREWLGKKCFGCKWETQEEIAKANLYL